MAGPVTEVNGLRLAYRGFITGLAAAYMWAAVGMVTGWLLAGDPLAALRPIAGAIAPGVSDPDELAFVLGLAGIQAGGGVVGMCFAYFFGRFFTVRATMAVAAPAFALLAWALLGAGLATLTGARDLPLFAAPIFASLGYGLLLGLGLPLRGEVTRAGT